MTRRAEPRAAECGFTLLELLVAITLLGLLMVALFGGLGLGARVWEAADARLDANARIQIVQDFIRQRLAETLPLETVPAELADIGVSEPLFVGTFEAVGFATLLPENLGAGIYIMELALAASADPDGHHDLVLRWRPFEPDDQAVTGLELEERVLLEKIEALELSYFGTKTPRQPPDWWPTWEGRLQLPQLIRVRIRFADQDDRRWPELIVRPMVDEALAFQS